MASNKKLQKLFNDCVAYVKQPENWVENTDTYRLKLDLLEVRYLILDGGMTCIIASNEVEAEKGYDNDIRFSKGDEKSLDKLHNYLLSSLTYNKKKLVIEDQTLALIGRHYKKATVAKVSPNNNPDWPNTTINVGLQNEPVIQDCFKLPSYTQTEEYKFALLAFREKEGRDADMSNDMDCNIVSAIQIGINFAHRHVF